jgi:hypothetical protein
VYSHHISQDVVSLLNDAWEEGSQVVDDQQHQEELNEKLEDDVRDSPMKDEVKVKTTKLANGCTDIIDENTHVNIVT